MEVPIPPTSATTTSSDHHYMGNPVEVIGVGENEENLCLCLCHLVSEGAMGWKLGALGDHLEMPRNTMVAITTLSHF